MSTNFLILQKITSAASAGISVVVMITYAVGGVAGLSAMFLVWFVYSGVIYFVSTFFGGDGDFRITMRLVGWGFVPLIFSGTIGFVALYVVLQGVSPPESVRNVQAFVTRISNTPTMRVIRAAGVVFVLWQGLLWVFATKHARDIDTKEAVLTVALPTGLTLVWSVYQILS